MKPRMQFYRYILATLAISIFFLGLGIYGIVAYIGQDASSSLLELGVGGIIIGSLILWQEVVRWIRPLKANSQSTSEACPFCGALVGKDVIFCEKYQRQLNEHS